MSQSPAIDLGRIGIWSAMVRYAPDGAGVRAANELENLGFQTVWVPGGIDDGVLASLDQLLDGTGSLKFATGIINIWKHEPADVAAWFNGQSPERQARLMLGLGVSHGLLIGDAWAKPLAKMREYISGLGAAGMPRDHMCVAALGPKMLEMSAARTAGAHPYMVTASHTRFAREALGPDALLAPELTVILETDPAKAREIGRGVVKNYARLANYANNWRRDGFTDAEIEGLDDRLVDAVIAWGDLAAIKARLDEYFAAGADHVCLQAIGKDGMMTDIADNLKDWRELAKLL